MEITKHIHQIEHHFEVTINEDSQIQRLVNILIIFDKELTIIDTGTKSSFDLIKNYLESNGRSIKEIKNLILSHSHPDHIGSALKIKEESKCKVFAHSLEKQWIENIQLQSSQRPIPGFYNLVDKSVNVDIELFGGEILELGSNNLKIINSPGHSPGSINIFFKEENMLFTGDNIPITGDIPNYYDYKELKAGLTAIKNEYDPQILLSSWESPVYTRIDQHNLIQNGLNYLDQIDKAVKKAYKIKNTDDLKACSEVIKTLKMPKFFVNPLVDKSFRSHLN